MRYLGDIHWKMGRRQLEVQRGRSEECSGMEQWNLSCIVHKALSHIALHLSLTAPWVITGKSIPTHTWKNRGSAGLRVLHQVMWSVSNNSWHRTKLTVSISICFQTSSKSVSSVGGFSSWIWIAIFWEKHLEATSICKLVWHMLSGLTLQCS